ncbi:MAG TPA: DUF72 domain-containing protein [Kofleriaceae bacterium]|nr:DUF72 domain-containing protein [Kofleriaceae bacterium]
MAKHVIVGCAGLPRGLGWPRYFQRLPYLELGALLAGPVRSTVLRRWREAAPSKGSFGVVAPSVVTHTPGPRGFGQRGWPVPPGRAHEVGGFKPTEPVTAGVAAHVHAMELLDAAAAVYRTPPDFSPSAANRDAMRRFFSEVATPAAVGERLRVWHPSGLWEPPAAQAFAEELGILCALDPIGADPTGEYTAWWAEQEGDEAYFAVTGLARGRRTPPDRLEELAEIAARYQRAWVVFATSEPFPDAIRFSNLVGAGGSVDASITDDDALEDDDGEGDDHDLDDDS